MRVIKEYLFEKELAKVRPKKKEYLKVENNVISSITILTDAVYYDREEMRLVVSTFTNMGIDCDGFLINAVSKESENERIEYITRDDYTWYDAPKSDVLVKWLQHKSNLLVTINPGAHPVIHYLSATSNCLLKTAVMYDGEMGEEINFSIQITRSSAMSLKDICMMLYEQLVKLNRVNEA